MKKLIKLKQFLAILFLLLIYIIYKISGGFIDVQNLYEAAINVPLIIVRLVLAVSIVIFLVKTGWTDSNVLTFKNTASALLQSVVVLLIIILTKIPTLISTKPDMSFVITVQYLFALVSIAVFEEFFFRLGIINIIFHRFNNTVAKIRLTCFLSGLLFGLIHFSNLAVKNVSFTYVITQVIFTVGFGSFTAALYLRNKNIWGPVIIHILNNITLYATKVDKKMDSFNSTDDFVSYAIAELLIVSFWFIVTAFLLRKKKLVSILPQEK